ncbi:MAG: flavodoxin family protein [Clostridia bacterium]
MKALLLNGSPHRAGCTFTALNEVARALRECGVESEIFQLGEGAVRGCTGCGACAAKGACIFEGDPVNAFIQKMRSADALVIGSPVYYAAPNGALLALLDRAFYAAGRDMRLKPGAAVVSARRAGTTASLDVLNKYFTISQMPIASSSYWNMVHGNTPDEVRLDAEGMQVMRTLGRNLAWLIKSICVAGLTPPEIETPRARTHFIR